MLPGTEPGLAARRGQTPSDPVFTALSARRGHYYVPTLREDTVPKPCPQLARPGEIQTQMLRAGEARVARPGTQTLAAWASGGTLTWS